LKPVDSGTLNSGKQLLKANEWNNTAFSLPREREMETQQGNQKESLSLHEAACLLSANTESVHAMEVLLAHAIEHGELQANVQRWATEQWDGRQLPGNINRLGTFIERGKLDGWQALRK